MPSYAEKSRFASPSEFRWRKAKLQEKTEVKAEESKGRYWKVHPFGRGCVLETASGDFHGAPHRCCSGSAATTLGRGRWHAPGDLQFRGGVLKSLTGAEWYRTMIISEICDFQQ